MAGAEKRIATLSSYVPQQVLRHVATGADATAEPHSERFSAALLLIDITGFTPMTAAAVRRGPAGVEQLSRSFNAYLGRIIERTVQHGGDIYKIVGDALMPVWPAGEEELATVTRRAAACGLAIATELGELEVEGDRRLALKIGLCAGEVVTSHLGGTDGRWLFLIGGDGVGQLAQLEPHLQTGDVISSPSAWSLVGDRFIGQPLTDGHVRLRPTEQALPLRPLEQVKVGAEHEGALRGYIPDVLLSRVDAGQAEWLAEVRNTTVVFANVLGAGERGVGEEQLIQDLVQRAQRLVRRYDGWLKEITQDEKGTTLIAVFGVPPYTHEDDAARGVQAAFSLQAQIGELGLRAGIGVASGPTFCAPVGNSRRRDFAMLGRHVNLAARLMRAAGDEHGILCDASTYEQARDRHVFERLAAYVLKGLDRPIDVYLARPGGAAADRRPAMVDRTREVEAAAALLAALREGRGGLLTIEGEPGIGKSRIVAELLERARRLGIRAIVGSATDIDLTTPYNAWRQVFEELLGVTALSEPRARQEAALVRVSADDESRPLAPLLGPVLSLDLPDNEATAQLRGQVRADNTRDLLIRLLRVETASGPLLVVLEDVHWLDSASWLLVHRARREIPQLLVVMTSRPVAQPATGPAEALRSESTHLRLARLERDDALALAAQRTGALQLAEPVARIVHARAEGNPLFIEQLTYAMRDAGLIVVDQGTLRAALEAADLEGPIIPDTVQRVITSRLDQLSPTQAMALKVASVIGQRFAVPTLADIYPLAIDRATLEADLETLARLDLVAPAPSAPQPSYQFRHKVTQEVAYNLMPPAQTEQLHARLAEWYEGVYGQDLSPFHPLLAYHWRRAGRADRAMSHLELAGAQALRTFANEEAIGFLREALSLAADGGAGVEQSRRATWHLQLGEAHVNLSQYREGREHLELGLKLMDRPAPVSAWQRSIGLPGQIGRQLLHRLGLAGGARSRDDAHRAELVAVCRAYERLAEAAYYGGDSTLALYSAIRVLNDAESSGSPAEIARGLAGTGVLFGLLPLPRVAEWYMGRALSGLERVSDLTTHEIVRIVAGYYDVGAGRWEPAREQFTIVRGIARRLGDRRRLQDALSNLSEIEYLRGNFRPAADIARELIALARARGDRRFEAEGLAVAAYAAWQLREADEAVRLAGQLKSIVAEQPDVPEELRVKSLGVSALIHLARGERSLAMAAGEEAMRLVAGERPASFATFLGYAAPAEVFLSAWETGQASRDVPARAAEAMAGLARYARIFPVGRPRQQTLAGRHAWLSGRQGAAYEHWRRAVDSAVALAMPYEQGLAHLEIGRHLPAGEDQRQVHLGAARELFAGLEAVHELARVDAAAGRAQSSAASRPDGA